MKVKVKNIQNGDFEGRNLESFCHVIDISVLSKWKNCCFFCLIWLKSSLYEVKIG